MSTSPAFSGPSSDELSPQVGRPRLSLVSRLERILAAAMGAALLIALVLISSQEVLSQRAAVSEGSQAWLNTLAVQAASPLVFDDAKAANEILRATSIYPGLQAAYILRSDGSTMARHLDDLQEPLSADALKRLPTSAYFDRSLLISTPVLLSHEEVGRVVAKIDLTPMWRSVLRFGVSLMLALGISGIVAALAARRFLHRALQPLAGLKQVMDEVAQQERFTVRAALVANDEVGDLSIVFNHMLDQIVKRDGLLEDNNRRLLALKEAAEQASTTKSAFLALMSHELRTPMAGILGMLKLSLRGQMESTVRERVELACKNANALLQIVNDLLDGSKIEAGKLSLESVDFALHPLLDDAMELLQERAEQKSIGFALHVDPRLPLFLKGDPTRLRQVLLNLVGNAIKFTEQGGVSVNVRLQSPQDMAATLPTQTSAVSADEHSLWVHFAVQDSGIGISEEAQGRMFQKFEQADMSTTRNFGGTGLGLSICKQLVELMGGRIGMHSTVGSGSIFYFDLPLLPGQQPIEQPVEDLQAHDHQLHVLVAEDAETNQLIIKAVLSDMGHTFTVVSNGEKALEALTQESFDLILMDGRMPIMDGLEATQHIRAGFWGDWVFAERDIPIIALTANASELDRSKFLAVGMSDFLRKPVDEVALHHALSRVIEQRKAQGLMLKPKAPVDAAGAADLAGLDALLDLGPVTETLATPAAPESVAPKPGRAQRVIELREQMLQAFRAQAPLRYREIEAAVAAQDWPAAAILAHGIKGCLAFIAPEGQAYELSDWLERMADNEDEAEFIESFELLKNELLSSLDINPDAEGQA
ncbi:ATP-binding protein [Paucibacter sp. Y2R2-4]|uniref:ATP-binding protein n=1 Tax=Paucibacter sp. Y2R2-4 TaxID=2893553 RepID=UPI0021E49331|nr:ATP-binding protein [Paucibacter sp. Y2R2-4]MCV2352106.1 response regulator [Paucibacter sp. Y2R2-4]